MSKPRMIEKAKNCSLVVLFLSTVLLLYFFWGNISDDAFKASSERITGEVPKIAKVLKPEQIFVNFGSGNYTVVPPDDIWYNDIGDGSFVEKLSRFGPSENILVEEITYAQYQQVMQIKSIWAEFNYDIPMTDFCLNFNMKKPQSYDAIETVTAIGYSAVEEGKSLFIYDGKNQKYYRLVADTKDDGVSVGEEFSTLIDSVKAESNSFYYPISSYLGVENNTLVPLSVESSLRSFPYRQEIYSYQTEKISALAEQFFGGNFDFVRKITEESGNVIYMYGYGQNVLIVNTDGSIEYKEEQMGGRMEQSFTGALETAVNFVASHGSQEAREGTGAPLYLKEAVPLSGKGKGFRFIFGMEVNGNRLYYEDGNPIIVEVIYGQVTYYKRHIINFDLEEINTVETASVDDAFSSVNLIAQNYRYIYDILLQSGEIIEAADPGAMFEDVASLVNNMQIGYLRQADREITEIRPVWVVTVIDTDVYFDLYTAEPLGYSAK